MIHFRISTYILLHLPRHYYLEFYSNFDVLTFAISSSCPENSDHVFFRIGDLLDSSKSHTDFTDIDLPLELCSVNSVY